METQPDNLEPLPVKEGRGPKRDFWIGFIGWFVFNILAGGLNFALSFGLTSVFQNNDNLTTLLGYLSTGLGCLIFLLNIGALIFFAFRRKQIALGMLVAFGLAIAITILVGVVGMAVCFYMLGTNGI